MQAGKLKLSETAAGDVLQKKMFLKMLQYLQETPVLEPFKKRLPHRCFSVNIAKLLRMLFYRTLLTVTVFQYSAFYKSPNFRNCFIASVGYIRNNPAKVLLEKGVLKICSKFTTEHQC